MQFILLDQDECVCMYVCVCVCVSEMVGGEVQLMSSITFFVSLLLAGTVIGVVIYTGKETRSVLNTSFAKNKVNTTKTSTGKPASSQI